MGGVLVTEAGFGSEDTGTTFSPIPTSAPHLSDEVHDSYGEFGVVQKREIVADACQLDPKQILSRLPVQLQGWCELVQLEPTKAGGYIQISFAGANKFAMLQLVVLLGRWQRTDRGGATVFTSVSQPPVPSRGSRHS